MSSFIIKYIANRVLKDNQWNRLGVEDPYYEYVPLDADGKKHKKIKRTIPEGLSTNDKEVLEEVRKKAYRYDMWFAIFGVKFGWSNIIGAIPVVGQVVATYWSLTILVASRKLDDGLPLDLHCLYIMNILIDFLLGLIPIVGDLVEIGYKANSRNFLLLEKHLYRVGQKNLGYIQPEDVRPGFINEKVGPIVEDTIIPGTKKAGVELKQFAHDAYERLSTPKVKPGKQNSGSATISTFETTASSGSTFVDDDDKSIKSLNDNLKKY